MHEIWLSAGVKYTASRHTNTRNRASNVARGLLPLIPSDSRHINLSLALHDRDALSLHAQASFSRRAAACIFWDCARGVVWKNWVAPVVIAAMWEDDIWLEDLPRGEKEKEENCVWGTI